MSECTAIEKSTGKTAAHCAPINQPIKAAGKMLTILHNSQSFLFEPVSGTTVFETVEFSELCALTETSKVTGTFVLECKALNASKVFVHEDYKNHQKIRLLQQAPEALFPSDVLKYGTHVATLDGIVAAELAGANAGLSWSGEA